MADGHHPQQTALSSAAHVGMGVTGVSGGDRRPHMNYKRPRVSTTNTNPLKGKLVCTMFVPFLHKLVVRGG